MMKQDRLRLMGQIMAGFAANPAVFAHNDRCGWSLVNCTDGQLVEYVRKLADHIIEHNEQAL